MEFKRRRMIKSEIDRLLSDEGTRNLLSGIKVIHKSKKLTRIVTRNRVPINKSANSRGIIANNSTTSSGSSRVKVSNNSNEKTKKIIKKSLSLLGHSNNNNKINGKISNGPISSANKSRISNGGTTTTTIPTSGGAKLSNGVRGSGSSSSGGGAGHTTPTPGNSNAKNTHSSGGGSNSTTINGIGPKVTSGGSGHSSTPSIPLLAISTIVRGNLKQKAGIVKRGHVAFITLSYQNHLCVLRTQDLRDLIRKFEEYESRKTISVIVMNSSSDRFYCDGLDYKELIHSDLNKRKLAVQHRITCIKNVLNTLAKSKKLLIASVNGGKVNGFGLMMLGLFDMIYANDKATFSLQKYFQLKQPPEGISVFSQTQLQSAMMKSLVFMGKIYTASEMNQNGFITEVLWDGGRYHEQLALKLQNVNVQEHTKSIYKTYSSKNTKQLGSDLSHEFSILETVWNSDAWQKGAVQQLNRDRHN